MKSKLLPLLRTWVAAMALSTAAYAVQAQTFTESVEAYQRGDFASAFAGFQKLAETGAADAQYNLGLMFANGRGVARDPAQAAVWYRKAAEQGRAGAQHNLGVMYTTGNGVPKDEQQALFWHRKAAEQGHANAQYSLGLSYANGRGLAQNDQLAVQWYRKSAEQGYASAQHSLGLMYQRGRGVARDDQQAVFWYRRAAEQGNVRGQTFLGLMYANGTGIAKDEQQAYFWWVLASASGAADVLRNREMLERRLPSTQVAAIQAEARAWKPKVTPPAGSGNVSGIATPGDIATPGRVTIPGASRAAPATRTAPTRKSSGSGFRIAQNTFVTNYHVIDGCTQLHLNGVPAQVSGSDRPADLALLSANQAGPVASLRGGPVVLGEAVIVAGYPLRGVLSGLNVTTGNLSSLTGIRGDMRLLQITAPVQRGNSGGPLLDMAGNLTGVVVSKLDALKTAQSSGDLPQNVNFAISVNALRSFLDANNVDYRIASANIPMAITTVAELASGFTVLVECWK